MITDPVADMLTRIRNANSVRHNEVRMPSTKLKISIAEVLKREGYIVDFALETKPIQNELVLFLKFGPEGEYVIQKIERVSRPGCRIYRKAAEIDRVLDGLGISIVSTNRGVLSDRECREKHVGGEVLARVW
jgi:small subunit ribosomal protein S8